MNILKNTTLEYQTMADKLIVPLFELLKKLALLEKEIFERNLALDKEKTKLNIPANQLHPKWNELMEEYNKRFKSIITGRVSERLMEKGYADTYSNPGEYAYTNGEDFFVEFIMQKEDFATVIIYYNEEVDMKHKFVLKLVDGKWLIDEKYYGFGDEKEWYEDKI